MEKIAVKKTVGKEGIALLCHVLENLSGRIHNGDPPSLEEVAMALDYLRYNKIDNAVEYPMRVLDLSVVGGLFDGVGEKFSIEL